MYHALSIKEILMKLFILGYCYYWQPLNETSMEMTLDVVYQPISAGTLRLWVTMIEAFRNLYSLGNIQVKLQMFQPLSR